jgi:hypothetical protein
MKKELFIIIGTILFTGCFPTKDTNNLQTIKKISSDPYSDEKYWKTVEYNGHQYITANNCFKYSYAITHDPDCPCHSNRLNQLKQEIIKELKQ